MDGDPGLDTLDTASLTPLLQRALRRDTVELLAWQWAPIGYNVYLPNRTLVRFSGTAAVDGYEVPWSLVLKKMCPPSGANETGDEGWNREALAYSSGLLTDLAGPLTAARALSVTDDAEGTVWLWLEDVSDHFGHAWPLAQYGRAARHLGQFNGAYLVDRRLPDYPWLLPAWAEHHSEPWTIPAALPEVEAHASDVRVRRAFPIPVAALVPQLVRDQPLFISLLSRLPQTLCHHDATRANLFARRTASGTLETIAVDWESVGRGTLGAEIATLVFGTVRRGDFAVDRVADLDSAVCDGYLAGLRDAGWAGDPSLVRLGYTAAVALRWLLLRGTLRALVDDQMMAIPGRVASRPRRPAVEQCIPLSLFLLACADEARHLARRLSLIP